MTTTVNSSPVVISLSLVEGMTVVELSAVSSFSSGDGFFTVKRVSLFQFTPRYIPYEDYKYMILISNVRFEMFTSQKDDIRSPSADC